MKKILAAALALTMSAAMFTACGDDSSSSSAAETTTTTAAEASSTAEEASSTDEASSTEDASSAEDASSDEGGSASSDIPVDENGVFDLTKMPGYDASATETVLTVNNPVTEDNWSAWSNGLGSDDDLNAIYIDGRTFTRDQDLTITVEFAVADYAKDEIAAEIKTLGHLEDGVIKKGTTQILIGPARANGWAKFMGVEDQEGLIVDFPTYYNMPEGDTHGLNKKGEDGPEDVYKADGTLEDVFVKNDGFIKFGTPEATSVTFTIPKEKVNEIIDNAYATPADESDTTVGWDGIIFQMGDCATELKTITLNMGNVYFSSDVTKALAGE